MPRKYWDSEPERRAVRYSDIPEHSLADSAPKGWWDRVIEHLLLIRGTKTPVLELDFGRQPNGHTSLHNAAARRGLKVSVVISGNFMYVALCGKRDPMRAVPPRKPIICEVCGVTIIRPRTGGSRQFVCGGNGGRKSKCQSLKRMAQRRGISVQEFLAMKKAA